MNLLELPCLLFEKNFTRRPHFVAFDLKKT